MSQAQTVDAPRVWAATVKPPIPHAKSACVQGACASLGSPVLQTKPDGAIRDHGRIRTLVAHVELVGPFPMGQNRSGFRTNVGVTLLEAREKVAVPRDEENRWPTPPGASSLEGM